ncbi:hypothetical protein Tcan_14115 [Toxocara canis]|uniref:Uncharacterized protein n=1 Tax=Toxocara canis TaxID=6265 RepID=A0A0B2V3R3_TOXCA|nr:hypothetical protein Tcan_14115 [Toxocara canis]
MEQRLQLLKRPLTQHENCVEQPLLHGLYGAWTAKAIYCKRKGDRLPRICILAEVQVVYSNLRISSAYPTARFEFPLVTICYIESHCGNLTVKGRMFYLRLRNVDHADEARDRLRFLVLRQRVPHSILGLPFEWQVLPAKKPKHSFAHLQKYSNLNFLRNAFLDIKCIKKWKLRQ